MLTLSLGLILALGPVDAEASAKPRAKPGLSVEIDECLALDPEQLRETVELQLGAGIEHRTGPGAPGDTHVLLDCGLAGEVELTLIDPISGSTLTRTVELPPAERRAERLGVQTAALVRAAWMTVELERPRVGRRTRVEASAARIARRPPTAWELGDGFVVRTWFGADSPSVMMGEQVEVLHRPLRHLAWKADGELAFWQVPVQLEEKRDNVATLSISAAPALLGYGEVPGRGRRGAGTVAIYGGAGFRVGGVRMRSDVFGESDGFEAWAGPLTMLRASVSLGRFVGLALDIEAGWVLHGPERPNGIPLSLIGPYTNGALVLVSRF